MNVFDILGPVMIGPSSSHTAGSSPDRSDDKGSSWKNSGESAHILHGSFAKTYKGHGTDKALVAGILGMQTDDERIRFSLDVAKKEGLEIQIETGELEDTHPNTAEISFDCSRRGKSVSSGQQYWRGEYPDHPGEWNGGCPYRAESSFGSCFTRMHQGRLLQLQS